MNVLNAVLICLWFIATMTLAYLAGVSFAYAPGAHSILLLILTVGFLFGGFNVLLSIMGGKK